MSPVSNLGLGWLVLITTLVGCQAIVGPNTAIPSTAEMIPVKIRPAHGKAKLVEVPLEANMTLQHVLDKSGARFRHRQAYIVRVSPQTGNEHKLAASFGPDRRISLETDYAMQPGDRVVISQDTRSSIERAMSEFLGG